jgi:hypothetical protein
MADLKVAHIIVQQAPRRGNEARRYWRLRSGSGGRYGGGGQILYQLEVPATNRPTLVLGYLGHLKERAGLLGYRVDQVFGVPRQQEA